jgi:lysophospholipase L1-like esterase
MRFSPLALLLAVALHFVAPVSTAAADFLHGAKRVLFLGDSITYGGQYVDRFEMFLFTEYPGEKIEVINCGLPSETVSGLSEPGHANGKFPRPDLHERLGRVLEKVKPNLVFACYGMNDGIYLPLAEDRFATFQDGMRWLHKQVTATGARIVHLTPPVFDPTPPEDRATSYDAVLARYAAWLLEQRKNGWEVIDLHGPMSAALEAHRKQEPAFTYSRDHIHPNEEGHAVLGDALIAALDPQGFARFQKLMKSEWATSPAGKDFIARVRKRGRLLTDAWLTETGHVRPGMAKGLPLAEAETQAAGLESQIRATPVPR